MKTIWVHTLVKNEERFVWHAVRSVVEHVDKVMVWDTGSTDNTVKIVKNLQKKYPKKIDLQTFGDVTPDEYTQLRQKMLDVTRSDWFMILDGDEVWWEDSIKKMVDLIHKQGDRLDSIVNPYINVVGDIYHFIPKVKGNYRIDNHMGHISIRFINRRIPGLYTAKPHGQHGYFDEDGVLVQERNKERRLFVNVNYLHFTHLRRSSNKTLDKKVPKRARKFKYELGKPLRSDFYYPEVFFNNISSFESDLWHVRNNSYVIKSFLFGIPKKVKSLLPKNSGY